jgi:tetratricopeptide (TPR) repeat protein
MIKNDYLTTKLKELSELITKVLKSNDNKQLEESREMVNEAFKRLLGLNSELAESLSYKDLMKLVGAYESAEALKFVILAQLLKLDGDMYKAEGEEIKSFNIYLKSLNIYIKAVLLDSDCLEQGEKIIDEIINEVEEYELPKESSLLLFNYYELVNKYDKAEDMLFELLEADDNEEDIVEEGIGFYERLLEKTEEALENGNLPLDEVKEGIERLKAE